MERSLTYNGTITAEQFLFYEIRIASKYYLGRTSVEDAIGEIKRNNLFQYPTERLVARMVRSCYKRLDALDDDGMRQELSEAPVSLQKRLHLSCPAVQVRWPQLLRILTGGAGGLTTKLSFSFS